MLWCEQRGICPYIPGTPEYNNWYMNRISQIDDVALIREFEALTLREEILSSEIQYHENLHELSHIAITTPLRLEREEVRKRLRELRTEHMVTNEDVINLNAVVDRWQEDMTRSGAADNMSENQLAAAEALHLAMYPYGEPPCLREVFEGIRTQYNAGG